MVEQSPAVRDVRTETEDIVEIRHQATTGEDSRLRRLSKSSSELQKCVNYI
jgi:hypothetical protein